MKYIKLTTHVPKDFRTLAKRLNFTPDHLAFCILRCFVDHPQWFRFVSRDPNDARQD
jgi:hypothetical protein